MKFILILSIVFLSCKKNQESADSRTYRMGFQNSAPRFDDINLFLQSLNLWMSRADAAIVSTEVPWDSLLAGVDASAYVIRHYKDLVALYRNKNLMLWVYIDPQNGLERRSDANALVIAGKSIAQPDIQQKYKSFVIAMDSILKPEHLGLALETNLIRIASTPAIYNGMKQAANDVAKELKIKNSKAKLSVSIQVDLAWGGLGGLPYQGIAQDLVDFPFIEELGFSSYPYLIYNTPAEIPQDYYTRLMSGINLPVFVSEGGWASKSVTTPSRSFISSDAIQKEYVERHHQLLNSVKATALFQLAFTDIDVSKIPPGVSPNIAYFTTIGLVDTNLQPKPSLSAWDANFKKQLR